jgi:hypothetical protein
MNELNKEFSENPNRREEEEEERREKEEGRRRKKTNNNRKESEVVTQKERKNGYSIHSFASPMLKRTVGLARVLLISSFLHFLFNNYFFPSLLISSDFDFSYIV